MKSNKNKPKVKLTKRPGKIYSIFNPKNGKVEIYKGKKIIGAQG